MDYSLIRAFERENVQLADFLSSLARQEIYFFPNPGNAGDSMIAAATYQIFEAYRIKPVMLAGPDDAGPISASTVVLGGGGNLNPIYGGMAGILKALVGRGNRIVLLPHSIRGHESLIFGMGKDVTLHCRELASYRYLRSLAAEVEVCLSHDLAVYLDPERNLSEWRSNSENKVRFEELLLKSKKVNPAKISGRSVWCIRGGAEGTLKAPRENYDISVIFKLGSGPEEAQASAGMMLEFCRLTRSVTTNRLHVGIAAGLMGRECKLLDNSYGKLSSVFDMSLRSRFSCVSFDEQTRMKGDM